MKQRSPEWFTAKLGKVGASRVHDVTARTKTGYGASRAGYMAELITERLTGIPFPTYINAAMQAGIDNEDAARNAYAFLVEADISLVGFVLHPTITGAGASPDGLVGEDGLVEIKAPTTATHIATLLGAPIDGRYIAQMQWQMVCMDRKWCDFCSYDPRLPEPMQLHVQRVSRDDMFIARLENEVIAFLDELESKIKELRSKYMREAA